MNIKQTLKDNKPKIIASALVLGTVSLAGFNLYLKSKINKIDGDVESAAFGYTIGLFDAYNSLDLEATEKVELFNGYLNKHIQNVDDQVMKGIEKALVFLNEDADKK
jgi:hypothetical protein